MTYLDRLRRFLSSGECLLLVIGYSFKDEHLNATIFEALRSNNRLAVTVLLHASATPELLTCGEEFRNLSILSTDVACIGGVHYKWSVPSAASANSEQALFWDAGKNNFTLGDFTQFAEYLKRTLGTVSTQSDSGPVSVQP